MVIETFPEKIIRRAGEEKQLRIDALAALKREQWIGANPDLQFWSTCDGWTWMSETVHGEYFETYPEAVEDAIEKC